MVRLRALLAGAVLVAVAEGVGAQTPGSGQPPARREAAERGIRQALARQLRQRVGLSDSQLVRLQEVNGRFQPRRRDLMQRERTLRQSLRRVLGETSPDGARVDSLLEELVRVQRDRVQLFADEQQALKQFMTPVQRARLAALQEQLRRRMDEMRRTRARAAGPP